MRIAVFVLAAALAVTGQAKMRPAVPLDPVKAVLDAFAMRPVVTLPGKPVNREITGLILSIIRDSRFPATVNDIVVEFGSARYQDLIDRYVRGDDISEAELKKAWQDVTEPSGTFDGPLTVEVFRAVRAVNAALPRARQIRILAGDPPIDWDNVKEKADHRKWIVRRDSHAADVVASEVLARGRKALLIFGNEHFPRKEVVTNYDMSDWQAQTLTSLIERLYPGSVFVIFAEGQALYSGTVQPDTKSWPSQAIAYVKGTVLGEANFEAFSPTETRYSIRGPDDFVPMPREQWRTLRAEEQFDAILKLPENKTNVPPLPGLCSQPGYVALRLQRIAIAGLPPGVAEGIRKSCS